MLWDTNRDIYSNKENKNEISSSSKRKILGENKHG